MFRNGASLIGNADKVVMWGCNFVDAWWQHWWPLADAMEKGSTRLIVVDPNYSTTASKANMWVSNRPGSTRSAPWDNELHRRKRFAQ